MIDVLWATLALCAAALSAAGVALMLALRKNAEKAGQSLDSLNKELPAMLAAARMAAEDADALLSFGRSLGRTAAWAGGLFKGARAVASLFRSNVREEKHASTSGVGHE